MNEISKIEPSTATPDMMPWTPPPATAQLLASIIEVAKDPTADIAKVEKLIALHDRMKLAAEEEAFDAAMNAAQAEMGRIATDSNNPQTHSKYASYGAMDRMVRPIYTKHGFSLMFDTGDSADPKAVLVTCRVSRGGCHRMFKIAMPADGKGARGNDVMTTTHATGSAVSYGRRYLLGMIFNLATGKDDDALLASGTYNNSNYTARRAPQAAPNVLRKVVSVPAYDPDTGEIHDDEPVREDDAPAAPPESPSAPSGLAYAEGHLSDEEKSSPPPSAAEYVARWEAIADRADTIEMGEQMIMQWNKEKTLRNLILWPHDDIFPALQKKVREAAKVLKERVP
jgi:hypothetical protein